MLTETGSPLSEVNRVQYHSLSSWWTGYETPKGEPRDQKCLAEHIIAKQYCGLCITLQLV